MILMAPISLLLPHCFTHAKVEHAYVPLQTFWFKVVSS